MWVWLSGSAVCLRTCHGRKLLSRFYHSTPPSSPDMPNTTAVRGFGMSIKTSCFRPLVKICFLRSNSNYNSLHVFTTNIMPRPINAVRVTLVLPWEFLSLTWFFCTVKTVCVWFPDAQFNPCFRKNVELVLDTDETTSTFKSTTPYSIT